MTLGIKSVIEVASAISAFYSIAISYIFRDIFETNKK
ncbi:hypothetical protein IC006_1007 [Sulfuracidifex tepidarius]|uniref:Uncharacterized protein n=1 Tax=Sulfuracidifex tepidarius TaxID=1294262 RepID=A0A510DU77_9CREN|nr:hypothetical protein IC006_1007 [Sulfuracidifex tepidarius]BBG26468.1 hypothetical protein IC007_0978 [Sulfuracidifex tepidarius]